jgi:hypothetical protein
MVTLSILPNFKGTTSEWIKATISCILLDSTYVIPIINHYL